MNHGDAQWAAHHNLKLPNRDAYSYSRVSPSYYPSVCGIIWVIIYDPIESFKLLGASSHTPELTSSPLGVKKNTHTIIWFEHSSWADSNRYSAAFPNVTHHRGPQSAAPGSAPITLRGVVAWCRIRTTKDPHTVIRTSNCHLTSA